MAKRTVAGSDFERIAEGHNVLKITKVEEDDQFKKLKLTIANKEGTTDHLTYSFEKNDGSVNNVALAIYTRFAGYVLGIKKDDEFEDSDLLNKYFECEVTYEEGQPYTSQRTGKEVTPHYIRLNDVHPAVGFDEFKGEDLDFDDIQF